MESRQCRNQFFIRSTLFLTFLLATPLISHSKTLNPLDKTQTPYTVRNITDGKHVDYHPDFSPDGKEIVFSSKREKGQEDKDKEFWDFSPYYSHLWVMDSDGGNKRQLTTGKVMDFLPGFTPDGKKILFVSNRENGQFDIWSMMRDGSNLTRLTNTQDKDYSPKATPDGKQILFFSKPLQGNFITESIWIMDIDGSNKKRLTSGGKGDWYPSMSPDGQEILFASMRLVGGSLWSIDRDGKNYKRLTYGNMLEFFPHWSPDGTKMAYVSRRGQATFGPPASNKDDPLDIWLMDKDGMNKRRLTTNISGGIWDARFNMRKGIDFISYYHLSWHPDGTKMALTTFDKEKGGSYISIIEFDKGTLDSLPVVEAKPTIPEYTLVAEEEITSGEWEDFGPSFSPDGNSVSFASNRDGNWDIWNIELETKKMKRLTDKQSNEVAPVYSPDGREILYLSATAANSASPNSNPKYSIWVMSAGGEQSRQLTDEVAVLSYPAWSPDSSEVIFASEGAEIWRYKLNGQTLEKIASVWGDQQAEVEKPWFKKIRHNGFEYPFKEFLYRVDYNAAGDRIVFESNRSGNVEIWTMGRDGTKLVRITEGNKPHWNPIFSPNGKKIAYATEKFAYQLGPPFWPAENYNIWIADTATGKETLLTGEEQTDWNPSWSPDGKRIAYVTNRSGDFSHFSIWMLYLK